jgi:predicted permease
MTRLARLVHGVRALFSRKADRELDEELRAYVDLAADAKVAAGASRETAYRAARLETGNLDAAKELVRDIGWENAVLAGGRDIRHAGRLLRRAPGFTAAATLTLALGIGATTAIASVVYGVLLKPLPFADPDRLVALYHVTPASRTDAQSAATYFTYRDHGRVFDGIGLWTSGDVSVVRNASPEQVHVLRVTEGTLSLLGVRPERGRLFQPGDDVPNGPARVVLAYPYWRQAFGASPDVVGQPLVIDGTPHEVIGVLPRSFRLLENDSQVVLPLQLDRAAARTGPLPGLKGIARLKAGVTLADADADIARMIPLIVREFPLAPGLTEKMWASVGLAPNVRPLAEAAIGEMRRPLWTLLGAVGVVLLMAWANVANLLLVRAEGRRREFAVRCALGASRRRMAAALLSESLILGLAGGAVGVLLAGLGVGLLRRLAPVALPRVDDIGIDAVVLLFTLVVSVVTSLLFGLLPVLRMGALNAGALTETGRSTTDPPGRHRVHNILVVVQIALALVLLVVSGLMVRTFVALRQVDPGFVRPAEAQVFDIVLPPALIREPRQVAATYEQMAARLQHVPGVQAVGLGVIRLDGIAGKAPLYVDGRAAPVLPPIRSVWTIGGGYFDALGNALVAGRAITWSDILESRPVAVISQNLAREFWPTPANAVGQRIGLFPGGPWQEVVGVAGDVRADGLNRPAPQLAYFPMASAQGVSRNVTFIVRSSRVGTPGFLRELQQAVWSVNPNVPLAAARTLQEIAAVSTAQTSFALIMLAIAAAVALLLALVGVYGVVSYVAAERTHEIGIRMALGAQSGDVRTMLLRRGVALTLAGLALGLAAAMLVTPVITTLLYGIGPLDPLTYAGVALALGAAVLLATYLPVRRAARQAPIGALRAGSARP